MLNADCLIRNFIFYKSDYDMLPRYTIFNQTISLDDAILQSIYCISHS